MVKNIFIKLRKKLAESTTPWAYYIFTFIFVVFIRNFLEIFSDHSQLSVTQFFHYSLFYITLLLSIVLIVKVFFKEKWDIVFRLLITGFIIIIIPPIIDLIVSVGKGFNMAYIYPTSWKDFFTKYITFVNGFKSESVTIGMKVEVISIIIFLVLMAVKVYKKKIWKAILFGIGIYTLLFLYSTLPFLLKEIGKIFSKNVNVFTANFIEFYLIMIFVQGLIIAFKWNKEKLKAFLKHIPYLRVLHFTIMPFIGIMIARKLYKLKCSVCGDGILDTIYIVLAIIFASLFVLIINNLADRAIDKISNKKHSKVIELFGEKQYKAWGTVFLILSILFSVMVDFKVMVFVLIIEGVYFIYSSPPLRLKKIPVISKLMVGFNTLVMVLMGYQFAGADIRYFPFNYTALFLFVFGLSINFIDIKDYEGDKADGIKTLPVLLGLQPAKYLIATIMLIGFVVTPFLMNKLQLLYILIPAGIATFFLVIRKKYSDKAIMIAYAVTLFLVIILKDRLIWIGG